MATNQLSRAKKNINDEFYTRYIDIENELKHYDKEQFRDKIIYCNCDGYESNFLKYFKDNYDTYKYKLLIGTGYNTSSPGSYYQFDGSKEIKKPLNYFGSFDSPECIDLFMMADIIVTNPPFSQYTKLIYLLRKHNKEYLLIANLLAITYKEQFTDIAEGRASAGINFKGMYFHTPEGIDIHIAAGFYTTLKFEYKREYLDLPDFEDNKYDIVDQKFKGNKVININRCKDIPKDYKGYMAVPFTFMNKENFKEYKLYGIACGKFDNKYFFGIYSIKGKKLFARLIIKKKDNL